MTYQVSDRCLDEIEKVVLESPPTGERLKIADAIQFELGRVFAVHPRVAFAVGIALLLLIFAIDFFYSKYPERTIYQFLILLASSLTAASVFAGFASVANLDLKWFQATGSAAVFALVFLKSPLSFEQKLEEEDLKPEEKAQNGGAQNAVYGFFVSGALAQDAIEPQAAAASQGSVEVEDQSVDYVRVLYPRGIQDLKERAINIYTSTSQITQHADVVAKGSIFTAVTNKLRYKNEFSVEVKYLPGLDDEKLQAVLQNLRKTGLEVDDAQVQEDYGAQADVAVYLEIK